MTLPGWKECEYILVKSVRIGVVALAPLQQRESTAWSKKTTTLDGDSATRYARALTMIDRPGRSIYDVSAVDQRVAEREWKDWLDLPSPYATTGGDVWYRQTLPRFEFKQDHVKDTYVLTFDAQPIQTASKRIIVEIGSPNRHLLAVVCPLGARTGSPTGQLFFHGPYALEFFRATDGVKIGETKTLVGCERSELLRAAWSPDSSVFVVHANMAYSGYAITNDLVWVVAAPLDPDRATNDASPQTDGHGSAPVAPDPH